MEYITGDTHFSHRLMLKYRKQYQTTDEMNEDMINNWNKKVKPEDVVYHLGDIQMRMPRNDILSILKRLNGKLVIIKGNHDDNGLINYLEKNNYEYSGGMKFEFHSVGIIINRNKKEYYLSHYPMDLGYLRRDRANLHGHIHQNVQNKESCLNVGVDSPEIPNVPFGQPILLNKAMNLVDKKSKKSQDRDKKGI